jgi:uncharacterized protein (TIRG00374 family)
MIVGLVVFVFYLYFFIGFNRISQVIQTVNLRVFLVFYFLALGTVLVVMLFWVMAWRNLMSRLNVKVSLKHALMYYWTGYFLDLIVPCQQVCGEVTRIYLVQKETKNNYGVVGAAGITNRIIAYTIVFVGLTVGVLYLLVRNNIPAFAVYLLVISWIGALAYLAVMFYLANSRRAVQKIAAFIVKVGKTLRVKRFQNGLSTGQMEALQKFNEGFAFFRSHPRYLVKPIFYQGISYWLYFSVYVQVFFSVGFDILMFDFLLLTFFLTGALQDALSAFSVGGLEIILTSLFIYFGVNPAASSVAATILRTVIFWFPLLVGYVMIYLLGMRSLLNPKMRELIQEQQKLQMQTPKNA